MYKRQDLTYLKLQQDHITDISALAGLTELKHLDLWSNEISELSPLKGLSELREVKLSENPIVDLSPLMGLENLEAFSADKEGLADPGQYGELADRVYGPQELVGPNGEIKLHWPSGRIEDA